MPTGSSLVARPIRLLLVDDHPLVREGLAARFGSEADITVVGEAASAEEALRLAAETTPHVVLTDIGMRGTNGIELTRQMMRSASPPSVLILSMYDNPEYAQQALAAGARGYVIKDSPSIDILTAIRTVASGGTWISPELAQKLFRPATPRVQLSEREQQILALLADGRSSKEIARRLDIGVRTVETHRQSIRRKLDLEGQAELIRYAVEHARGRVAGS